MTIGMVSCGRTLKDAFRKDLSCLHHAVRHRRSHWAADCRGHEKQRDKEWVHDRQHSSTLWQRIPSWASQDARKTRIAIVGA